MLRAHAAVEGAGAWRRQCAAASAPVLRIRQAKDPGRVLSTGAQVACRQYDQRWRAVSALPARDGGAPITSSCENGCHGAIARTTLERGTVRREDYLAIRPNEKIIDRAHFGQQNWRSCGRSVGTDVDGGQRATCGIGHH